MLHLTILRLYRAQHSCQDEEPKCPKCLVQSYPFADIAS